MNKRGTALFAMFTGASVIACVAIVGVDDPLALSVGWLLIAAGIFSLLTR